MNVEGILFSTFIIKSASQPLPVLFIPVPSQFVYTVPSPQPAASQFFTRLLPHNMFKIIKIHQDCIVKVENREIRCLEIIKIQLGFTVKVESQNVLPQAGIFAFIFCSGT